MGIGAQEWQGARHPGRRVSKGWSPVFEYLRERKSGQKGPSGRSRRGDSGGNVAMDTVRTALRNGSSKPFIVYRRSEKEMPANEEEIHECREEGIEIMTLTNPKRIIGENGVGEALNARGWSSESRMASGRRRPVGYCGVRVHLEVDAVVPAIGQESDWACLTEECACRLTDWGTMTIGPAHPADPRS